MPQLECHPHRVEAAEPRTEQGRCFHGLREHTAARSHEGRLTKLSAERAQIIGRKRLDRQSEPRLRATVALEELFNGLAVRQIKTATSRKQKLAADGRHLIVDGDARSTMRQHVARHQSGGPASDNGYVMSARASHERS